MRSIASHHRAHERDAAAVRRERWRSVAHPSAGQLAGATPAIRSRPEMRLVGLAGNAAQRVDDGFAAGRQAERFKGDLRAHRARGVASVMTLEYAQPFAMRLRGFRLAVRRHACSWRKLCSRRPPHC